MISAREWVLLAIDAVTFTVAVFLLARELSPTRRLHEKKMRMLRDLGGR